MNQENTDNIILNNNKIINNFKNQNKNKINIYFLLIFFFLSLIFILLLYILEKIKNNNKFGYNISNYEVENKLEDNFKYHDYQREKITTKMIENANWKLWKNEPYFINGLIRKLKPKNCLELGVADGGSAVLILNALKDIPNSFLVSIDFNTQYFFDKRKKTGYIVNQKFPELSKNWRLLTGDLPHKFLVKLNIKFDFVFIDTTHYTPGELINIIEVMPFLNNNAIVVVHDITWHFWDSLSSSLFKEVKFTPTQIYLISSLVGKKIIVETEKEGIENIGAVILDKNQQQYYINYFLLLLSFWEEMPSKRNIIELKAFIKKYYKKDIYLKIFNQSVNLNRKYIDKYKKVLSKFYLNENGKLKLNNN